MSTLARVACVLAIAGSAPAIASSVPTAWLARTAQLESGGDDRAVGDFRGGVPRSRGRYQIQEAVWRRFSRQPWQTAAHDPVESRRVAACVLEACAQACRTHGQAVTFERARWWYRHGGY